MIRGDQGQKNTEIPARIENFYGTLQFGTRYELGGLRGGWLDAGDHLHVVTGSNGPGTRPAVLGSLGAPERDNVPALSVKDAADKGG